MTDIVVRPGIDLKTFREQVLPANEPIVLNDLVGDWPAVRAARESPRALGEYLRGMDQRKPLAVLEGPASIRGPIHGILARACSRLTKPN